MSNEIILICGLGNPGKDYEKTRHNIGFEGLDAWAQKQGASFNKKFQGEFSQCRVGDQKVFLLKPMTYMNLSGQSMWEACKFYKISPENCLVLHDEMDLPLGSFKLKVGGGHAGHNGLRSIMSTPLGRDFARLRIGITPESGKKGGTDFVLGKWTKKEFKEVELVLEEVADAIDLFLKEGAIHAQNEINRRMES
jgi:PTH1 family peptidyl-tRNA hydrolase